MYFPELAHRISVRARLKLEGIDTLNTPLEEMAVMETMLTHDGKATYHSLRAFAERQKMANQVDSLIAKEAMKKGATLSIMLKHCMNLSGDDQRAFQDRILSQHDIHLSDVERPDITDKCKPLLVYLWKLKQKREAVVNA